MSLKPYKVTALAAVDTNGKNVIPGAKVHIKIGDDDAELFLDSAGSEASPNPFFCGVTGEAQIWIEQGSYSISVADGNFWDIFVP